MISNTRLKQLAKYRLSKNCNNDNVFVVEGEKIAAEALIANLHIVALCATADWLSQHRSLFSARVPADAVFEVANDELKRLSNMQNPNKVWLLAQQPDVQPVETAFDGLTIALDHIQDPGNMGTIIRIADWFGIRHIVCSTGTVNCLNPKVIQASMGSVFRTAVHYTHLPDFLAQCRQRHTAVCGTFIDGDNIYTAQLPQNAVVVIGNESKGIDNDLLTFINTRLAIPNIGGTCESLNASVATGIVCSEFCRRQTI